MHLGAGRLKTGIAVTLALIIASALNMTPPIMTGIAAAVMDPFTGAQNAGTGVAT